VAPAGVSAETPPSLGPGAAGKEQEARELDEQEARELDEQEARELDEQEACELDEQEARELDEQEARELDEQEARELDEQLRGTTVPFASSPGKVWQLAEVEPDERARRAADALGLIAQWALANGGERPRGREGRFEVVVHVDAEVLAADTPVGRCGLEGGAGRLPAETVRRLCCSSPVVTLPHGKEGEVLGPGRRTRGISAPLWRALRSRDETCAFPGCTARHGLVVHHVEHWVRGGETMLPNLIRVCRAHHWALHEGGFRVEGRAPAALRFRAPGGDLLPTSPVPPATDGRALARRSRALGLAIGPQTGLTRWRGEAMDYDWAVQSLLRYRAASTPSPILRAARADSR